MCLDSFQLLKMSVLAIFISQKYKDYVKKKIQPYSGCIRVLGIESEINLNFNVLHFIQKCLKITQSLDYELT